MQFCNQCGGPVEGDPAQCPSCGAVRHTATIPAGSTESDDTSFFTPPGAFSPAEAPATPAATGPLSDAGPFAPDTRYSTQPAEPPAAAVNGTSPSGGFDPYTGQPIAAPAPPTVDDGTSVNAAPSYAPPPPPPVAAPPPPVQAPPESAFQTSTEPGSDIRPEIREIIMRVLGGRYTFLREIGAGGMSVVYEMEDTILQTHVAVKVLYPELAINPEVANRFKNEAVITAKLTGNPHIIKVYDYGYKERIHYIITQYLSGHSLRDEMKNRFMRNEKFDWREAAEVMIAVGKALESVHSKNVVHRDIKPGNIIFENGQPVLIDFGIAKIPQEQQGREWLVTTQAGMSLGTPHYISPEEAQGLGSNPKSDIYSLGVVFYEMVAGRVPFDGESAQQIMIDHVTKEPDDPTIYNSNLPSHIAQIVLKLLRKDPNQRLSATELVQNLEAQLGISSRGSSAAAEAISLDSGRKSGGSGSQVEGATVVGKSVLKGKKIPGKGGADKGSPVLTGVLILATLGGVGYLAMPYIFPPPQDVAPVEEVKKPKADPIEEQMSQLYDAAVVDIGERHYKTAFAKFKKVYAWNNRWRSVEPAYFASKDFLEAKDAYLSGRARTSFEKAKEYFAKADQKWKTAFAKPFPFADEYMAAALHMSDAIGAEEEAKKQTGTKKTAALWDAQRSYEKVAEKIPWEAGAYFARLDNLIQYYNVMMDAKDKTGADKAVAQMQGTIDQALTGLEDDKENLLRVYEVWADPIYRGILKDAKKADEYKQIAATVRQEWDAAGNPGPDEADEVEAQAVEAAPAPRPVPGNAEHPAE